MEPNETAKPAKTPKNEKAKPVKPNKSKKKTIVTTAASGSFVVEDVLENDSLESTEKQSTPKKKNQTPLATSKAKIPKAKKVKEMRKKLGLKVEKELNKWIEEERKKNT